MLYCSFIPYISYKCGTSFTLSNIMKESTPTLILTKHYMEHAILNIINIVWNQYASDCFCWCITSCQEVDLLYWKTMCVGSKNAFKYLHVGFRLCVFIYIDMLLFIQTLWIYTYAYVYACKLDCVLLIWDNRLWPPNMLVWRGHIFMWWI